MPLNRTEIRQPGPLPVLCKHFAGIARIFVSSETGGVKPVGKSRNELEKIGNGSIEAKILPNPASEGFEIQLPGGTWSVEVRDVFRKLVLSEKTVSGHWVDAQAWNGGLYFVNLHAPVSGESRTLKVLVAGR